MTCVELNEMFADDGRYSDEECAEAADAAYEADAISLPQ